MKKPFQQTSAALCVSTVLTAGLMCLLHGEHYAQQLETAWPVARPLSVLMSTVSEWSGLPRLRAFCQDKVDACCAALWRDDADLEGLLAEEHLEPEESPERPLAEGQGASPAKPADFCGLHLTWLGGKPPYEFCGLHLAWLGKPAPVVEDEPQAATEPEAVAEAPLAEEFETAAEPETVPAEPEAVAEVEPAEEPEATPAEPEAVAEVEPAPEPAAPSAEFHDFHAQWVGMEKAELLVNTCPVSCRVMMMGDSLMEDFGVYFYQHVKSRPGLQIILLAKFSTGLCRPDYFNWFEVFPKTVGEKRPHIVLYMIGANDGQPVWYSRGNVVLNKPAEAWKQAYGERVNSLLEDAQKRQALSLWVGMPVMGSKYASLLAQTEEATREECARRAVPYVDNRALLADNEGKYQSFIKNESGKLVRVRRKDKDHMTPEGNRMLVRAAMTHFEQMLRQHRLNHPELCVYPEQKNTLVKPSLDIVIPYKPKK